MNELEALRGVYNAGLRLRKTAPVYNCERRISVTNFDIALASVHPLLNTVNMDFLEHPVVNDLGAEITRAIKKFPSNEGRLYALLEELGELTQAMLEQKQEPEKNVTDRDVYNEAIQVACVALRIAMEGDSDFPYVPVHS